MRVFHKLKTLILCFTTLFCIALAAQERRPVAVLEPFVKGPVTSLNKRTVRGAVNSFLVNTGVYKVVDRARAEQILEEQSFQRIHLSDSNKAKQLGKLLGADLICFVDLIKEEGYFNAELNIIDVEIGEVTNAAYKLIASDDPISIDGAIREAMTELLPVKSAPPSQEEQEEQEEQEAPQTQAKPEEKNEQSAKKPGILGKIGIGVSVALFGPSMDYKQMQTLSKWGKTSELSELREYIIAAVWDGRTSNYNRDNYNFIVSFGDVSVQENRSDPEKYLVSGKIFIAMDNLSNGKSGLTYLELNSFVGNRDTIRVKIIEQASKANRNLFNTLYNKVR